MKTDDLIALLASEVAPVDRHVVAKRFATALLCGLAGALLLIVTAYGIRADLAMIATTPLFWAKLAAPLANPAMALIGAAMVLLSGKSSRYMNFGLSVGLGFFFWAVIIMSQEAGNSELLPPLAAGFAPALLFAAASLWGLRRSRSI